MCPLSHIQMRKDLGIQLLSYKEMEESVEAAMTLIAR
jgi:hypothetical protein